MEVKPGYKLTEAGVIPNDWEIHSIGASMRLINGRAFKPEEWKDRGLPIIRIQNLNDTDAAFNYCSDPVEEKHIIEAGDLLFAWSGTLGTSFGARIWHGPTGVLNQHIFKVIPDQKKLTPTYTLLVLGKVQEQIEKEAHGFKASFVHVKKSELTGIQLPLPPTLAEQESIASALTDADNLIAALDQLLTKKRQLKQAAMQQLLTGKQRIPGFTKQQGVKQTEIGILPKDWEILPLKSISTMHGRIGWQGLKQSEFTMTADDPFLITGMNFKDGEIRWDEVYHIPPQRYEMAKEIQLKSGDVLMTKDGTIGKILYVDQIPHPGKASLNSHLLVFRPINNKYIPKFLFYQLNSKTFHNHIEQEKSGTTFFGITQEAVGKYNAFVPSIPEQIAIAEILSDMDAEITALEARLTKARQVKQGMMQELLTGRLRLI